MNVGILLLAAGGSSRMGSPKQLLPYRGSTLVRHAMETALGVGARRVLMVLGANAAKISREVADLAVDVVENCDWETGMGSSISAGVGRLMELEASEGELLEGCVVMLGDQPLVTPEHLKRLIQTHRENGKPIVASAYGLGSRAGVPVFFSRGYFGRLRALEPSEGGKTLMARNPGDVCTVTLTAAAVDIDTPEDYRKLREMEG